MGWVTDRDNCTLKRAFDEIRDVVERDIAEANDLVAKRGLGATFVFTNGNGSVKQRFYAEGWPLNVVRGGDKRSIVFVLNDNHILIESSAPDTLQKIANIKATQKWDVSKASCSLCVGDNKVTAEEISQMALEPLFFK